MRGQPIPFRGREQVVEAYSANGIWPWAIFAGKELFIASEEDDEAVATNELDSTLRMLEKGGSDGIYTLRVYKNIPASGIDYATKPSRGFNFKLYSDQTGTPWERDQQKISALTDRCAKLEQALQEREEEDEEPEQVGGVLGMVNGLLSIPEIRTAAIGAITGLLSKVLNMNGSTAQPAQVAGIPGRTGDDQIQKAENALDVLIQHDQKIGDHLEAIAKIAVQNPGLYNSLIGMIPKA